MSDLVQDVKAAVRDIPDFPRDGVLFKDITPVLKDPALFGRVLSWMGSQVKDVDLIVGMEARGFIFAGALVERMQAGFVPARKEGKLPWARVQQAYQLEYGHSALEIHRDAISPGQRVVVVDDLLATGGTARATVDLVRQLGGEVVGCIFLIELGFLDGRKQLDCPVHSLVTY